MVQLLLKAHAGVNAADHEGWTALHSAACHGHLDVMQVLLDAHADINLVDVLAEQNALNHAAANGQMQAVQLLLAASQGQPKRWWMQLGSLKAVVTQSSQLLS